MAASTVRYYHSYFSPQEIEYLSEKQRGKLSVNPEKLRQQACGFIEAVGAKMGFPRKTIGTAQSLYHRFSLFFPRSTFHDVTMACLYVSAKLNDTLKKPRDILMASYAIRFPDLAARSKVIGGEVEMDPATVEQDRQHLLGIERLVLETISFNFTVTAPFPYVIKACKKLKVSKQLSRLSWRLAADSYRTLAPLQYPPHVIALACVYLASLLVSYEQSSTSNSEAYEIASLLSKHGLWEQTFKAAIEDLEEICHLLLDLLIHAAHNPSAQTSPSTPSSPSPHAYPSPRTPHPHLLQPIHVPYKHDFLMRLKIHLREIEHPPRPRESSASGYDKRDDVIEAFARGDISNLGNNKGTVRFLFGPARIVGSAI